MGFEPVAVLCLWKDRIASSYGVSLRLVYVRAKRCNLSKVASFF